MDTFNFFGDRPNDRSKATRNTRDNVRGSIDYVERGFHVRGVYPTQFTSRM